MPAREREKRVLGALYGGKSLFMAEEYVNENENGETSVNILFVLKRYALFIVITAFVFCCAGFAYSRFRTPTYTASETLSYTVSDNDAGVGYDTKAVNSMIAYFDTVIDFCKTGKVFDRANAYYAEYLTRRIDGEQNIDKFIKAKESEEYVYNAEEQSKYASLINSGTVTVKGLGQDDIVNIKISVENVSPEKAKILVRIYALAIKLQAKNAFGTSITTNITENLPADSGTRFVEITKDISTLKILIIAGLAGLVFAAAISYLLYIADTTVKSSEELARITGASLLSSIENMEEKVNG